MRSACAVLVLGWLALGAPRAARACGGGVVSVQGGAGADAQRIFFSAHPDHTDVITEIGVPDTSSDYGVLLPVAAQPTLDPKPISAADLDQLDKFTAPRIFISSPSDEGGCGCPFVAGGAGNSSVPLDAGTVVVSQPVNIGPVTAVVLTGATGDAVTTWLGDNGFVIPQSQQPLVDAYSGAGRYFIAIRRNDTTATGGASSVGVHFTLPGSVRTLPLRFATIGAANVVAFTVFVSAPTAVGPSDPFTALTLDDLDAATLRASGYGAAAQKAIAAHAQRAFIIDGVYGRAALAGQLGDSIVNLFEPDAQLTRLTTILPASALGDDVAFDQVFTGTAGGRRTVSRDPAPRGRRRAGLGFVAAAAALALAGSRSRPRRGSAQR